MGTCLNAFDKLSKDSILGLILFRNKGKRNECPESSSLTNEQKKKMKKMAVVTDLTICSAPELT